MRRKPPSVSRALVPIPGSTGGPLAPPAPAKPAAAALAGFVSENTKRAYERDLKDFFRTEDLATLTIQVILSKTPEDVSAFRDLLTGEGKAPSTVARKLSAVRALYNHLMARGALQLNPADQRLVRSPMRPSIRKTGYLSWDEARQVLQQPNRGTELGKRDYALLLLDVNTGLRRSELCHLRDQDVVNQGGTWSVRLRGKGGKERFVPIREDVYQSLQAWRKVRPREVEWLFVTMQKERFVEHQFWKMVKRYATAVGLETKVHPHALRAAYIAFLHDKGIKVAEIQQLVGHARGDTTLGYVRELELLKSKSPQALEGLDGEG